MSSIPEFRQVLCTPNSLWVVTRASNVKNEQDSGNSKHVRHFAVVAPPGGNSGEDLLLQKNSGTFSERKFTSHLEILKWQNTNQCCLLHLLCHENSKLVNCHSGQKFQCKNLSVTVSVGIYRKNWRRFHVAHWSARSLQSGGSAPHYHVSANQVWTDYKWISATTLTRLCLRSRRLHQRRKIYSPAWSVIKAAEWWEELQRRAPGPRTDWLLLLLLLWTQSFLVALQTLVHFEGNLKTRRSQKTPSTKHAEEPKY